MSENLDRQTYIDVAKGILIICVVIGHIINFECFFTAAIKTVIYTFHMPAFFIISGILMKPEKFKNQSLSIFLRRRIRRLIVPYVVFEMIGGVLQIFLYGSNKVNPLGILYGIATIHCHIGADWFLPTLFFAELIFFISMKNIGRGLTFFIAMLSFVIAFVMQDWNYGVAVIRRVLIAFGFIKVGYYFKKLFTKKKGIGIVISSALTCCISYYNGVVDFSVRTFNNPILYVCGGIVGAYCVLNLSQYLFGWVEKVLAIIGRNSLIIMGTHQHVIVMANVVYGSVYSINVQIVLLIIISIYESIMVIICRLFSKKLLKISSMEENNKWKRFL